jgi:hypothetical protein
MALRGKKQEARDMNHAGSFSQKTTSASAITTKGNVMTKQLHTILLTCLTLIVLLGTAHGGIPGINVIVSDSGGKVAFKGVTKADATFATPSLPPGEYVVQFRSTNATLKGNQYLLVVAAGKKKVIADAVAGEQFAGGGVAMKLKVAPGLQIAGQVANQESTLVTGMRKVRVINGQRYVWVQSRLGSNLGPHWEAEGIANANYVGILSKQKMTKMLDSAYEGSMLDRYHNGGPYEVSVHGY